MKQLWRWIQQVDIWPQQRDCQDEQFNSGNSMEAHPLKPRVPSLFERLRAGNWRKPASFFTHNLPLPPRPKPLRSSAKVRKRRRLRPTVALALVVLLLTAALGQRYYRQPELQVGTQSTKTVIAPENALVVDEETTEAQRVAARNGAVPVLVPDPEVNRQITNSLSNLFRQADILRQQAGDFPFMEQSQLSTATQTYIREASSADWEAIWSVVTAVAAETPSEETGQPSPVAQLTQRSDYRALSNAQQQAARELVRYQQLQSAMELEALQIVTETARANFRSASKGFSSLATAERALPNDPVLLRLSDEEWETLKQQVNLTLDQMLLQGIAEGMPLDLLAIAAARHLEGEISSEAEGLAQGLLVAVLEPNLIKDPEKTRMKAEAAAEQVPEVTVTVQAGDVIVRQGEEIDQAAFVLLDHFELSERRLNLSGFIGFALLVTGAVVIFLLVERPVRPGLRREDHGLILCMMLGVAGLSIIGLAVYSLPAIGLLVSSFYGTALGASVVALTALLLPVGTRVAIIPLIASAAGGLVCSLVAPRLRSREELALLGGVVGVIQLAAYLVLTWMISPVSLSTWYLPLTGAIMQGIYGVISSVVALGLSPYLEHLFDLVTPIRLAELSSPNRPLLQRLASEAPGTFQHTLFVASLAEAAARTLRCNVELVRAGTLYHDIGKMHDPQGFIENQMGGPNKHDEINDPWVSADIIKKHVTQGLVMARRCRLPKAVRAFIPEHQGTMQISYFHHKAMEMAKADPNMKVDEADFRYPGPIPQTPETGIVMLADSCEAALRSLKDASPSEALAMVNRILKARWRDGQLVDSGLSREHMGIIAQVFVQVWQQYNHKRIAYPKSVLNPVASRS